MTSGLTRASLLAGFLMAASPAFGSLVFNVTYDSTITSDPQAATIESQIQAALNFFSTTYSNNVTVSIYFQEGGGLGQSNFLVYAENYQTFYNDLVTEDANPAAIAGLNANGGNSSIDPVNDGNVSTRQYIEIKSANARAVGINIGPGCYVNATTGIGIPNACGANNSTTPVDGIISLNTSLALPDGDLTNVAEHEIDEILGLGSALENVSATTGTYDLANDTPVFGSPINGNLGVGTPEDLFRYTTGGTRASFTLNCASTTAVTAFFAYSPTTGPDVDFNNSCNGGDFGDWLDNGSVQDAFTAPGADPYTIDEEDAMSAIGYGLTGVPEPSTVVLVGVGLFALVLGGRRAHARRQVIQARRDA